MRLLIISTYWPRPGNAHNAYFEVDQVAAFVELGHEVTVLIQTEPWRSKAPYMTPAELGMVPNSVRLHQIVVPRLPEQLARNRAGATVNLWTAGLRLRSFLAYLDRTTGPVDAVIVNGERNMGLSAGLWNANGARRVAMIVHGADPVLEVLPGPYLRRFFGLSASRALRRVILVGNRLKPYARHVGYDTERVIVIPNGFRHPTPPAAPLRGEELPVRLVTAARLVKVKGIDDVLEALAQLRSEDPELEWYFDILGDGPERSTLERLALRLGLSERVRFHGAVPHAQVLNTLEQSAIFVLPSWNEAFGLAYLEAMSMGTAVVGCLGNGADDILVDGVDGCLVPPHDVVALAETLAKLIRDPDHRDALARAAMESVHRFSWPANARAVLSTLDDGS